MWRRVSRLVRYFALERDHRGSAARRFRCCARLYRASTRRPCPTRSGRASRSGIRSSIAASGFCSRMARTVAAQCAAPPSGRSSRVTEVTTTYLSFISETLSATRRGSSASGARGCPVLRGTEAAAPCADIAQNHEGRSSAAPAFGLVGTHAAAANRVQRMFSDYLLNLGVFRGSVEPDLQPSGFFQYIYLVIKLRHLRSLFSN